MNHDERNITARSDRKARLDKHASLLSSAQAASQPRQDSGGSGESERGANRAARAQREAGRTARAQHEGGSPRHGGRGAGRARHAAPGTGQRQTLVQFMRQNSTYILSVVAVVALAVIMVVLVRTFLLQMPGAETDVATDAEYESPYNWELLDRDGDQYAYVEDGQAKSRLGIDVSENQGEIDWGAVAADGVEFAMIRLGYRGATEGDLYLDARFQENLEGAKAAGIDCGIYFFSQANSEKEAKAEADFVVKNLGGTALEYPVAFDSEEVAMGLDQARTSGLDDDAMTAITNAFCKRVEKAGYRSIVYGNQIDLARLKHEQLDGRAIWWAEYDAEEPTATMDIAMWQYSNAGTVAGISTEVDMDIDLSPALQK